MSGPRTGPFDFNLNAAGRILIVQLRPESAMQVLGVPMKTLADRFEPLDEVIGPKAQRIRDFVLGDRDETRCVHAIESWLLQRIQNQLARCEVTDAVVTELTRRAGNIRIDELAKHVNLSRRHLGRIMTEHVGTSPKLFARISRFNRAVQLARTQPQLPWSWIALDAGYADQPHLTRDFSELGGIRPRDLRGPTAATIW